jgi:hypothetical protein
MTMHRRTFLIFIGIIGIFAVIVLFLKESWLVNKIIGKISGILKSPPKPLPESERSVIELPPEGESISIETALNSRCCSDYDGIQRVFHWGIFDSTKKLSGEQVSRIITLAKIPRFTDRRIEIRSDQNIITFVIESNLSGILKDWVMVESGMQQQAIGLVCAALGSGMVFSNLGKDGTPISDKDCATINIKLDPMEPSYNGFFWTSLPPKGLNSWKKGNLPDPSRKGEKSLLSTLASLRIEKKGTRKVTRDLISQLFWAARGRTPHLYKSRPWGMTIPTWAGEQNISSVYMVSNYEILKYVNWDKNRPTHSLSLLKTVDKKIFDNFGNIFHDYDTFIILATNEDFTRALWEVGYQMLNLVLQADALDLSYKASLLGENERLVLKDMGITGGVAILSI